MNRIATLDIGTNTVLLLIVERDGSSMRVLRDDHAIARLGEGVDKTGTISDRALERFRRVLAKHVATIAELHVDRVAAVGTSALRDAKNREEIVRAVQQGFGIEIEIISGNEEARWTYTGALWGTGVKSDNREVVKSEDSKVVVLDIGGGSTEIATGDGHRYQSGISLDIGAVRVTERCFKTNPIMPEAVLQARTLVRNEFARISNIGPIDRVIAVAGTPTTLAAMHQDLQKFETEKIQNYVLRRLAVEQLLDLLLKSDTRRVLELFPAVNKARADILPAGTLILQEAMEFLGVDAITVSTRGLRYGIAMRELGL